MSEPTDPGQNAGTPPPPSVPPQPVPSPPDAAPPQPPPGAYGPAMQPPIPGDGAPVGPYPPTSPGASTDVMSILGLVAAFVVPPIGLILSGIGLSRTGPGKAGGRGLAIAGMVLSVVFTVAWIGFIGALILAARGAHDQIDVARSAIASAEESWSDGVNGDEDWTDSGWGEDTTVATVAFGDSVDFGDGLTLSVASPVVDDHPDAYYLPPDAGSTAMLFEITIVNDSAESYDPSSFYSSVDSDGQYATQLIGPDVEVMGPSQTVEPGQSVTFYQAYSVVDPAHITMDASSYDYETGASFDVSFISASG